MDEKLNNTLYRSINPTDGDLIGEIQLTGSSEIDMVIENSNRAFYSWKNVPVAIRVKHLRKALEWLIENSDSIAKLVTMEQGKPYIESLGMELIPSLDYLKYLTKNAERFLSELKPEYHQPLFAHKKGRIIFEPIGTLLSISPWNYPFLIPLIDLASSITCGNTIILKPALETIFTTKKLEEMCAAAEFPDGVVTVLAVLDENAPLLTAHPGIDKIIFTGSVETGKKVMISASKNLTPVILELGGKDAAIVCEDADIERSAKGIVWGAFCNAGQTCVGIERVYVEKSIASIFTEAVVNEVKKLKIGDPLMTDTDIGPMTVESQMKTVSRHYEDALSKGATLEYGGIKNPDDELGKHYLRPTVLTNVDHTMDVMSEETFGPILPIMTVDSVDEAIKLANDSKYGLAASGWTRSRKTAKKIQEGIHSGQVTINDSVYGFGEPGAPWGGVKNSGFGRVHSRFGLMELLNIKFADFDPSRKKAHLWWYPYTDELANFYKIAYTALYSTEMAKKLKSIILLLTFKRFWQRVSITSILLRIRKLF